MRVSLGGEGRVRMVCFAHRGWAAGTVPLRVRAGRAQMFAAPTFARVFAPDHVRGDRRAVWISDAAWIRPFVLCLDEWPGLASESVSRSAAHTASPRRCTTRWRSPRLRRG